MMKKTFIEHLNESVNVLAFLIILYTAVLVHMGANDLANELIAGAIGLMGGKALNQAARRASDPAEKGESDAPKS